MGIRQPEENDYILYKKTGLIGNADREGEHKTRR